MKSKTYSETGTSFFEIVNTNSKGFTKYVEPSSGLFRTESALLDRLLVSIRLSRMAIVLTREV